MRREMGGAEHEWLCAPMAIGQLRPQTLLARARRGASESLKTRRAFAHFISGAEAPIYILSLLAHNLHNHPFVPLPIKLGIEDPLPRP
jgi:hypothetical protein